MASASNPQAACERPNQLSQPLVISEGGLLFLFNVTLAHDLIDSDNVIKLTLSSTLVMRDDIIDEVGILALDRSSGTTVNADYILSNDISTLPASSKIVDQNPLFVNAEAGDFHLLAYTQNGRITASPAIDFAPRAEFDSPTDLDGHSYGIDVAGVANVDGPVDLGAYEAQPITDRIFADAFGDPVSLLTP